MAAKSFLKVIVRLKKPSQKDIELVRRRALLTVKHSRDNQKLDAKAVEAMLRIVSGRYSDLHSDLEHEYRRRDHRLDATYARGIKKTKAILIKIEQDIRQLEAMGYDRRTSGIDYDEAVEKLRQLTRTNKQTAPTPAQIKTPASPVKRPTAPRKIITKKVN